MPPRPHSPAVRRDTFLHRDIALARLARPLSQFLRVETGGGIVLVLAAVVALVWANSPWHAAADTLWSTRVQLDVGSWRFDEDLRHVINDGLMAIFFFVVGLEIKRELTTGELRDRRQVALPAIAALGGMVVPALVYLAFNAGGDGEHGWGIPMATDIAFALGVMAVLGSRVPPPLRVFLLTLAIVDDLGAIAVIAVVYSDGVQPEPLVIAVAVAAIVFVGRRLQVTYTPLYVAAGVGLWLAVHESGVHATIAGVVMGVLTPARPLQKELSTERVVNVLAGRHERPSSDMRATAAAITESVSMCERLISQLHPWTSYVVVPLFALANAGIRLDANPLDGTAAVFAGVLVGLVVGKCVGVTGFAWLATRTGLARLPPGVTWPQFVATATLAGIGFTVSIFVAGLAFADADADADAALALADAATVAVLVASFIAAVAGATIFIVASGRPRGSDATSSARRT